MNPKKALVYFLFAVCMAIQLACSVSFSTARIADATLAKDVTADKEPVGPTTTFEPSVSVIHCVVKLANAPDETKVRARWSVVNVPGQTANLKIAEADVDHAGGGKNTVDFTFTPPTNGLPPGEYKIDLFLNPEAGKEDPPAKTLTFSVK